MDPRAGVDLAAKRKIFFPLKFIKLLKIETPLTLSLLTTTIVALPSNASKWQMGFNSAFNLLVPEFGI